MKPGQEIPDFPQTKIWVFPMDFRDLLPHPGAPWTAGTPILFFFQALRAFLLISAQPSPQRIVPYAPNPGKILDIHAGFVKGLNGLASFVWWVWAATFQMRRGIGG
jgi:hypothetical protein